MKFDRELAAAVEVSRAAAILCEDVRREMVGEHLTKQDRSPVTVADFGAQALICKKLGEEFPADPVVGEEDAHVLREAEGAEALAKVVHYVERSVPGAGAEAVTAWIDHGNGSVSPRYWTLDPIDGTKGFVRGDQYAIALALVVDGKVTVGTLGCPHLPVDPERAGGERGLLFSAVRGEGAFVRRLSGGEPTRIGVVAEDSGESFRLVESVESSHGHHSLQGRVASSIGIQSGPVRMDSQAKYGAVARGQAALYLRLPSPRTPDYRENIWDHAAGTLIVEEAGGRVTDVTGAPLNFGIGARMEDNRGVVVSNGRIHDRVLEELAGIF